MKSGHPTPKMRSTGIERFESVRAGDGLAVGHVLAGAFAAFSQFEAFACRTCGFTEFYRK
jgi:predicted nucleic-acid-binding Zn-ribbon protein